MAEGAVAEVAAVLIDEGRVRVVDAGVDVGDDNAATEDALVPRRIGADLGNAPLRVAGARPNRSLSSTGSTSG